MKRKICIIITFLSLILVNLNFPTTHAHSFPFSDIPIIEGNWKYDSVKYVYEKNIMNGISGTTEFSPDSPLTRAMFATVLYRMAGNSAITYTSQFTDVPEGKYYSSAILWAYQNGIVNGYTDGRYGINDNITREQIAKMLMEYANSQGENTSIRADISKFPDSASVSGWATDYVKWAVGMKMISGKNGGNAYYLDPKGQATRAECAAMITRYLTNESPTDSIEDNTHNHEFTEEIIAPTCSSQGYALHICNTCGYNYTDNYTDVLKHMPGDWETVTPATKEADGMRIKRCNLCGAEIETASIPKLPADEIHTCSFTETTVPASCSAKGYTFYMCNRCGHNYKDNYTDILEHTPGEWHTLTPATTQTEGVEGLSCSICFAELATRPIPILTEEERHTCSFTETTIPPTCSEKGYTIYTCNGCGLSFTGNYTNFSSHTESEWKVTKDATCTEEGNEIKECTECKIILKSRMIPSIGHNIGDWEIITEATCTEEGCKAKRCSRCDDLVEEQPITIKEHSYGDYIVDTPATCTSTGLQHKECSACGASEQETIPLLEHPFEWIITKEPSVTASTTLDDFGERIQHCTACDLEGITQTIINIDMGNGNTKQLCGILNEDMAYETFLLVNEERRRLGLNEYRWFDKWEALCKIRVAEIYVLFEHYRPNGEDGSYYNTFKLGENISQTDETAQEVFDGFCNSPLHYQNIINPKATKYYAACFDTGHGYSWVQLFY